MKQTEIGLIPDDWEVKHLGDVCSFSNGVAHENYVDDNGEFILVNSKFISSDAKIIKYSKKQLFKIEENTVLMVMSDVPNGKAIAKCFLVPPKFKGTLNQRICMFSEFKTDREFTYRIINRNPYYLAFDDGIKQTNLRKQDVLNCPIAFPPTLAEQQRIAKALSDVDALISTTEKLIQKKKNIKQGTMQNLLTGKKRLPGFAKSSNYKQTEIGLIPNDWNLEILKKIASFRRGTFPQPYGLPKWYGGPESYPFVQVADLSDDKFVLNDKTNQVISKIAQERSLFVPKGSVIVTLQGTIGRVAITQYDCYMDRTLAVFEYFKKDISKEFFALALHDKFQIEAKLAPGGIIKTITKEVFSNFQILIPSSVKEQVAIANVLLTMDKEIESLSIKLEKYRNLKTAMMQQLLTGKIRLI